jgi:ParB-like chromosome segregation protein Spo0J
VAEQVKQVSEIEQWPIEKLRPYEKNARTHSEEQVEQIAESMREFGFVNPIIVASDAGILAGHGRLMAANQLGLKTVPVIVVDHLDEKQRRAFVIADNKIAMNSGWDKELLAEEIEELDLEHFDLEILGFDLDELEEITVGKKPVKKTKGAPKSDAPDPLKVAAPQAPAELKPVEGSKVPRDMLTCPNCSHEFAPKDRVK